MTVDLGEFRILQQRAPRSTREGSPILIGSDEVRITGNVEVVRSMSYKMNVGNYESRDFFVSKKATCKAEHADETSTMLAEWCEDEVLESVRQYTKKIEQQRAKKGAA